MKDKQRWVLVLWIIIVVVGAVAVAFKMTERGIPRGGYDICSEDGQVIGTVTSGTQSPVLQCGIGMGYVPNESSFTEPGASIGISVRSRMLQAVTAKPPLHKT